MINTKRGSALIWIIAILILIIIGAIVYFVVSGDAASVIGASNSVPQPPALPN